MWPTAAERLVSNQFGGEAGRKLKELMARSQCGIWFEHDLRKRT